MIDQLQALAMMGAFSAGMTREEIETEFNLDCADLDENDANRLRNVGKLIQHTRAIEAATLVAKLKVHFQPADAVTLAAAILSKKS